MSIIPYVAGGLGGVVAGAVNEIYQANNILQTYQNNREAINQAVEVAQEIAEYIPRPPPGKRLRVQTPPKRRPTGTKWRLINTVEPWLGRERKRRRRR